VCRPFQNNLSTRILEKDYWVREPCSSNPSSSSSSSPSIPQNVFTAPV
jgi:hypothetical protein